MVSEGVLRTREGEQIIIEAVKKKRALPHVERRALMAMPAEVRRRHLREQAERIAEEYEPDSDWQTLAGEDFVEY